MDSFPRLIRLLWQLSHQRISRQPLIIFVSFALVALETGFIEAAGY